MRSTSSLAMEGGDDVCCQPDRTTASGKDEGGAADEGALVVHRHPRKPAHEGP